MVEFLFIQFCNAAGLIHAGCMEHSGDRAEFRFDFSQCLCDLGSIGNIDSQVLEGNFTSGKSPEVLGQRGVKLWL